MFDALKKYAQFSGRANREEFWQFYLLVLIVNVVAIVLALAIAVIKVATQDYNDIGVFVHIILLYPSFIFVLFLVFLMPSLAVSVRRLHDIDKSGWWCLLFCVLPSILLVWYWTKGTDGANRFGENPLDTVATSGNASQRKISEFDRFAKYTQFEGRANRKEFWLIALLTNFFLILCYLLLFLLYALFMNTPDEQITLSVILINSFISLLVNLVMLGLYIVMMVASVRRLHDIDRGGTWILIGLIPIVGWIILFIWYCTKGSYGANSFGDDPLQ